MFHTTIEPRFTDTDALGHINNTAFPIWFEQARAPIFKIFHPSLDVKTWPLIIARIEVDLKAQAFWGKPVEIRTSIGKLGNASCHVVHHAWQDGIEVASGVAVLIYYDYQNKQSKPIPDDIRAHLLGHREQ